MKISETELQDAVIDLAKTLGYLVHHSRPARTADGQWRTAIQGHKGFPDLCLARAGKLVFAELKSDRGKPTPEQTLWLRALAPMEGSRVTVCLWRPEDWTSGAIERFLRKVD